MGEADIDGSRAKPSNAASELLRQMSSSPRLPANWLRPEHWAAMAGPGVTVGKERLGDGKMPPQEGRSAAAVEAERARTELSTDGYSKLGALDWCAAGVPLGALAQTIHMLVSAGYPPVCVLMYDQAWRLCEALFDPMEAVLGHEMGREVALDASIFAWALKPGAPGADGKRASSAMVKTGCRLRSPSGCRSFTSRASRAA